MKTAESKAKKNCFKAEMLSGVHCPSCGCESVYVEPLTPQCGEDGWTVKCNKCFFRAESAATKEEAIKKWKEGAFTETSKRLSHPLQPEDMDDEGVIRLLERANVMARDVYMNSLKRFAESRLIADDMLLRSYIAQLKADAAKKEADRAVKQMNADMYSAYAEEESIHGLIGLSDSDAESAIFAMRKSVLGRDSLDPVYEDDFEPVMDEYEEGGNDETD